MPSTQPYVVLEWQPQRKRVCYWVSTVPQNALTDQQKKQNSSWNNRVPPLSWNKTSWCGSENRIKPGQTHASPLWIYYRTHGPALWSHRQGKRLIYCCKESMHMAHTRMHTYGWYHLRHVHPLPGLRSQPAHQGLIWHITVMTNRVQLQLKHL